MGLGSFLKDAVNVGTGGLINLGAGEDAANQARGEIAQAAQISADAEREKLDYLKEIEKLPLEIRNKFMPQYADIVSGGAGQQRLISSAMDSPLYQQLIGNQARGEESILKNASATGGLRSGDTSRALHEYNVRSTNDALTQAYNQQLSGIQGLAGIPLNTNNIANATAAPGNATAQGMIAGANAYQQGVQADQSNLYGLIGAGFQGAGYAMSDIRLKKNILPLGDKDGINMYMWEWNEDALRYGLEGASIGVMAHELFEKMPEAVSVNEDGYIMVDYSMLEVH